MAHVLDNFSKHHVLHIKIPKTSQKVRNVRNKITFLLSALANTPTRQHPITSSGTSLIVKYEVNGEIEDNHK